MKERSKGFLGEDKTDQDGEIFDYINELHGYLWRFVRLSNPSASGNLHNFVDKALTHRGMKVKIPNTIKIATHEYQVVSDPHMRHDEACYGQVNHRKRLGGDLSPLQYGIPWW